MKRQGCDQLTAAYVEGTVSMNFGKPCDVAMRELAERRDRALRLPGPASSASAFPRRASDLALSAYVAEARKWAIAALARVMAT